MTVFDPLEHPRGRAGRFVQTPHDPREVKKLTQFFGSMPRNSLERFATFDAIRLDDGGWRVQADHGDATDHDTAGDTAARAMALIGQAREREQQARGIQNTESFAAIFDGFTHGGLRARVTSAQAGNVHGQIENERGDQVGKFSREVYPEHDGVTVYHNSLMIDPEYRGCGFGSAFFEHSLGRYRQAGVAGVKVHAADQVGGYQWARRGYDFDLAHYRILGHTLHGSGSASPERSEALYLDERFARAYAVHMMYQSRYMGTSFAAWRSYGDVPRDMWDEFAAKFPQREQLQAYIDGDESALDGTFQSPAEIAMFGRTHRWIESHDSFSNGVEMWLGKRFLVGAEWRGYLNLGVA